MASNIVFVLLSLYEIFTNAKQNSSCSFITHLCLCIYVDRLPVISLAYYWSPLVYHSAVCLQSCYNAPVCVTFFCTPVYLCGCTAWIVCCPLWAVVGYCSTKVKLLNWRSVLFCGRPHCSKGAMKWLISTRHRLQRDELNTNCSWPINKA